MKFYISTVALLIFECLCCISIVAQDQILIRQSVIPETNEHHEIHFGIMFPPKYQEKGKHYPVIYYLHGLNNHYSDWKAQYVADFFTGLFVKGELPECIMVFPDGEEGFWGDHYDGEPLLEKEIVEFLIPYIDQHYPVNTAKRMIMGWSAGGAGAMVIFSKHPGLFKAAISLDGPIITWEEFIYFQGEKPAIVNSPVYYYQNFSPNEWVVRNANIIKEKQDTALFLSAALFAESHRKFLEILNEHSIPFNYRELDCTHDFNCVFSGTRNELSSFLSRKLD